MTSRRRLQQYAVAISIISVFYNTAEGVVSIVFGAESSSHSLVFYGIQSAIEVISALMVTWRFISVVKPGEEDNDLTSPKIIRVERIATTCIGSLLIALAIAAFGTSAASLAAHDTPSTALPSLIIAGSATGIMILLWLIKRHLARALNSSTMYGEALCSLECTQLSVVLLIGSLVYRFWKGGWWVDSATAIVIGLLFGWEGVKMVRWARSKEFDGGCCGECHPREVKGDDEAATRSERPDEKREPSPSSCSASSGCCGSTKKEMEKDNCCSQKSKGTTRCQDKDEISRSPCSALNGCCGNSKKEAPVSGCSPKKESLQGSCTTSNGCCGNSKEKFAKEDHCSRKENEDDATLVSLTPIDEKKAVSKSPCGTSSGCCGGSKKGRV